MKKKLMHVLRVLGSSTLVISMLLSCACTSSEKRSEDGPKFTIYDLQSSGKKYKGEKAGERLHELDREIFEHEYSDMDVIDMTFCFENPETYGLSWTEQGIEPWEPDDEESATFCNYVVDSLLEIDETALELEDQILYKSLLRDYQLSIKMINQDYYVSSINDLTGMNVELPILLATLLFDDEADIERYLLILNDIKPYFESLFQFEKKRAELGYTLPDVILEGVIESLQAVYSCQEDSYMYSTFEERINDMDLDAAKKQEYIARNKEALDNSFFPAYVNLAKDMETLYGTAKTSGSLSEMEGGKEFYENYFQVKSGTCLTVPEAMEVMKSSIFDYLEEFDALAANMSQDQVMSILMGGEDYSKGSFEENLKFCEEVYREDFPDIGEIPYNTYHIPESLADNFSPAAYMSSPYDKLSKNLLMVNDYQNGADIPTSAHEAFPGHMYETVYHMMNVDNYYMLEGATAYKEGWSTYSENYIMQYTDYDYNMYRAGYVLNSQILNLYLWAYADMGFHYYGWTVEECAKQMEELFKGTSINDYYNSRIWSLLSETMVNYCIEIPCYPTVYAFGNHYCCRIINNAVEKYGNEYTMTEIHKAYLDMGPCYYEVLEEYMPLFVEKQH